MSWTCLGQNRPVKKITLIDEFFRAQLKVTPKQFKISELNEIWEGIP